MSFHVSPKFSGYIGYAGPLPSRANREVSEFKEQLRQKCAETGAELTETVVSGGSLNPDGQLFMVSCPDDNQDSVFLKMKPPSRFVTVHQSGYDNQSSSILGVNAPYSEDVAGRFQELTKMVLRYLWSPSTTELFQNAVITISNTPKSNLPVSE